MTSPAHDSAALRRWTILGVAATAVIVGAIPAYVLKERAARSARGEAGVRAATFVGREACVPCHAASSKAWTGSDHDLAMDVANEQTVRGDFDEAVLEHRGVTSRFFQKDGRYHVNTEGTGGKLADFEIAYTLGFEPLQQYLVRFPGGRLQALSIAWDVDLERWFHLYPNEDIPPDDWLHWTRNGQNWNGMCAECHSTNLVKGYDAETQSYSTTWSEIDVSCEACHGPGSRHVAWAELPPMARPIIDDYGLLIRTGGITARQQVELCAPCHARRSELGDYDHTRPDLLDNLIPSRLEDRLYWADGQTLDEVYVYGSFMQSKMFRNDARCSDCHDVHSLKLVKEGNALCLQCHCADAYDSADHHFHKKTVDGKTGAGTRCVACHMLERPYMVIDERADHSLRVPRPDLTAEIGTPNACSDCHDDRSLAWVVGHYERWYGQAKKPHYGTTLAAGREGKPEARSALVRLAGDLLYPPIVRASALSLLVRYPGSEAAFRIATSDPETMVRYTAVEHVDMLRLSVEERVALVAPLLFDPVRAVRMQAATTLAGVPAAALDPYQREALAARLTEYQEAMAYSLDFAFAGHNLGILYSRLGDPKRAEAYYRAALDIDARFLPAKVNLAMLYNSTGRNTEAETVLREVLNDNPEMANVAYSLGLLLAEMNRFPDAAAALGRAAEGMPARARVHYNLALALQATGDLEGAEAALQRALAVEPQNAGFLYALADHYARRGALRRAMAVAERLLRAQPDNPIGPRLKAEIERALAAEQR